MPNENSTFRTFNRAEVGDLVITPVRAQGLAFNEAIARTVTTEAASFRVPRLTDDIEATWVAEGAEIPVSSAQADELIIVPSKIAAMTSISRELASDTTPNSREVVGESVAASLATAIDKAFVVGYPTPPAGQLPLAPFGLGNLTTCQTVDADPASGLDAYIDAAALIEQVGATPTAVVVGPATATALAKLGATAAGSALLPTARVAGARELLGLPLFVSRHVQAGTAWMVDASRIYSVLREDVDLVFDASRYLEYDTIAIRAIARVGFGFVHPESVVKIRTI